MAHNLETVPACCFSCRWWENTGEGVGWCSGLPPQVDLRMVKNGRGEKNLERTQLLPLTSAEYVCSLHSFRRDGDGIVTKAGE